jgi:hypothetical protein
MRSPRVRFTLRQIMVTVAVVAVGLSVRLTCQRHAEHRRKFSEYDHASRFMRDTIWLNERRVEVLKQRGVRDPRAAAITKDLEYVRQTAEYFGIA